MRVPAVPVSLKSRHLAELTFFGLRLPAWIRKAHEPAARPSHQGLPRSGPKQQNEVGYGVEKRCGASPGEVCSCVREMRYPTTGQPWSCAIGSPAMSPPGNQALQVARHEKGGEIFLVAEDQ
ncbi:hypothetical protein VTN96DRAFT_4764 [Rasamsonia emersonii]